MISTWILMITYVATYTRSSSAAMTNIEFKSKEACEKSRLSFKNSDYKTRCYQIFRGK